MAVRHIAELRDADLLRKLYIDDQLSTTQIAQQLGTCHSSIRYHLKKCGIPIRSLSESQKFCIASGRGNASQRGENSPGWKGGRIRDGGYIRVPSPGHCRANSKGYVREHILIWEQVHNKLLPEGWVIHHLNGIKDDNRPENLVAMRRGEHINQTEPFKKRIRELEAKVRLLEKALDASQMIFRVEEN